MAQKNPSDLGLPTISIVGLIAFDIVKLQGL